MEKDPSGDGECERFIPLRSAEGRAVGRIRHWSSRGAGRLPRAEGRGGDAEAEPHGRRYRGDARGGGGRDTRGGHGTSSRRAEEGSDIYDGDQARGCWPKARHPKALHSFHKSRGPLGRVRGVAMTTRRHSDDPAFPLGNNLKIPADDSNSANCLLSRSGLGLCGAGQRTPSGRR